MHPFIHVLGRTYPSYGLMIALGCVAAIIVTVIRTRRQGLSWEDAMVVLACAFGFALVGAAVLYLLVTYDLETIWYLLTTGELFTAGKIGLVFYGGFIGAIPGVLLGGKIAKVRLGDYVNALMPVIPVSHAFGRIGCFLGGCCYGAPTELPIGVHYPQAGHDLSGVPMDVALLPVQLFEAATLLVFAVIMMLPIVRRLRPLQNVALYLFLYAPARFVLEFFRYDAIRGHFGALSTSQWISIGLLIAGAALVAADWLITRKELPAE